MSFASVCNGFGFTIHSHNFVLPCFVPSLGELRNTFYKHRGPIFSLKWNKKGDCLLTGCADKTANIWDAKIGVSKQQFEFHSGT